MHDTHIQRRNHTAESKTTGMFLPHFPFFLYLLLWGPYRLTVFGAFHT